MGITLMGFFDSAIKWVKKAAKNTGETLAEAEEGAG